MNTYARMVINLGKETAETILRDMARKEAAKDSNNTGPDDARARVYKGMAETLDKLDLSGVTNPKSLRALGSYLEAFGLSLQHEADNMESEEDS